MLEQQKHPFTRSETLKILSDHMDVFRDQVFNQISKLDPAKEFISLIFCTTKGTTATMLMHIVSGGDHEFHHELGDFLGRKGYDLSGEKVKKK